MNYFFKTVLIFGICSCNNSKVSPTKTLDFSLDYLALGISFPPVADQEQRDFAAPLLSELNVGFIRIAEDWSFREPTQGSFNWLPLDDRINWAFNNKLEVLLTIQPNGPNWACTASQNDNSCVYANTTEFKNYVELLLQRYGGKIDKIQFGNEWQSDFWYIGTAQQFTEASNVLYQAVQTYSPTTKMVLGGFTNASLRFLAGCNGKIGSFYDDEGILYDETYLAANCDGAELQAVLTRINYVLDNALYDEVDIHLYDDVENWDEYYLNFKTMTTKPIIVSEFGGPNMNYETYSDTFQADRLYEYIKKIDSLQIKEAYYFKLVEGTDNPAHSKSGLIQSTDLAKKKSFDMFKNFTNQ